MNQSSTHNVDDAGTRVVSPRATFVPAEKLPWGVIAAVALPMSLGALVQWMLPLPWLGPWCACWWGAIGLVAGGVHVRHVWRRLGRQEGEA